VKYIIMVGVILPVGTGVMPDFATDTFDGSSEARSPEKWIKDIHFFCIVGGVATMGVGEFVGFVYSCHRQMRHPYSSRYYKAIFCGDHALDTRVLARFLIQLIGWALLIISVVIFGRTAREDVPAYAICINLPPTQCLQFAYSCTSCDDQTSNPYKCELKSFNKTHSPPSNSKHKDKKFMRIVNKCYNPDCNFEDNAVAMAAEYAMLWISVVNLLCHVVNRRIELGHEDGHEDTNVQDGNTPNTQSSRDYEYPVTITQNSNSCTTQMRVPVDEPILLRAMSPLKISSGASGIQIELDSLLVKHTDNVSPRHPTAGAQTAEVGLQLTQTDLEERE